MTRLERNAREYLSDWRVWMGVAYFGLAMTVVALWILFGRTAHEEALRTSSARASAATQVGQCFTSRKNAPIIEGFLRAHETLIDNSVRVTRESLGLGRTDPLHKIREQSLKRLLAAKRNAELLARRITKATPTKAACVRLARRLNVDPSRYLK